MTTSPGPSWRDSRVRSVPAPAGPDGEQALARRWPWAVLAAVLGAVAGAAAAAVVRRSSGDRPGAQEPHELRAVVDRPAPEPPG